MQFCLNSLKELKTFSFFIVKEEALVSSLDINEGWRLINADAWLISIDA